MCWCTPNKRTPICETCPEEKQKEWGYGKFKKSDVYIPSVGDRVSLEGEVVHKGYTAEESEYFTLKLNNGESLSLGKREIESATLLSRKSPRKVTRKEVEDKLGEPFELVD